MKKPRTYVKFPVAAVFNRDLSAEDKQTLLAYAVYANDTTGDTFVSAETIATKLGIKARQVWKQQKKIKAAGLMTVTGTRRTKTGHLTKRHKIIYKASPEDGGRVSPEDTQSLPKRPEMVSKASPEDGGRVSPEDRGSICKKEIDSEIDKDGLFLPAEAPDDLTIAAELWNDLADACRLPKIGLLTDGRKSKLKARLREAGGMSGWTLALDHVRGATWMHGANDRGWVVDFDFVLRPDKFAKLLEGGYAGRTPRSAGRDNGAALRQAISELNDEASNDR